MYKMTKQNEDRRENIFEISKGNIEVLRAIPLMMKDFRFRTKLRKLTLEFLYGK
jgi:hypothetical protein